MVKVFIDGSAGTTGLRIYDRLSVREDLNIIKLSEESRKDLSARKDAINSADVVFLCLPDASAIEAVALVENKNVAVIDTSTAHRTDSGWEYGFPELYGRREKIASSKRIANPGCHASGFIALTEPLVRSGVLKKEAKLSCFSITGYTGGGKKMIAEYGGEKPDLYTAPRQYGLSQCHKHLPEMKAFSGLSNSPAFCPIVADFACGMEVTVPIFASDLNGNLNDIKEVYREYYRGKVVRFDGDISENGFLSAKTYSGRDDMSITVYGNDERILLVSRFDNLGKGASGSAIQNMNILLSKDECAGLNIGERK